MDILSDVSTVTMAMNSTPNLPVPHYNTDHVVIVGANVVIGSLGILGNGTVIFVYWMNPKLTRSLTCLFILHQSLIDFISSVIFLTIRLDTWRPLLRSGVADIACKLWYSEYLLWVVVMTSTLNLLLVSVERYVCIVHSVFHRNHFTRKKAKLSMASAWLFGLLYQAYWAVVSTAVDGACEPRWFNTTMQTFFGITTFFVEYLIPLVLMTFSYACIISRLNQRCRVSAFCESKAYLSKETLANTAITLPPEDGNTSPNTLSSHPRKVMFSKAKRNVVKTLGIVFATYVICWTPTEMEYLVYNLGGSLDFNGPFHRITIILVLCNMCANPIIYALKYQEFRRYLKQMLCHCCDKLRRGVSDVVGSEGEQFNLRNLNSQLPVTPNCYETGVNLVMHEQVWNECQSGDAI